MRKGFYALPGGRAGDGGYLERFTAEINDDLNLPRALALAWELLRGDVVDVGVARTTLAAFDRVFGLGLAQWQPREEAIPEAVQALAAARSAARVAKQWAEADRLRSELHNARWEMEDRADGYALKRRAVDSTSQ